MSSANLGGPFVASSYIYIGSYYFASILGTPNLGNSHIDRSSCGRSTCQVPVGGTSSSRFRPKAQIAGTAIMDVVLGGSRDLVATCNCAYSHYSLPDWPYQGYSQYE